MASRRTFLQVGAMAAADLATSPVWSQVVSGRSATNGIREPRPSPSQPDSPPWVKDLIIYEIATKGFTSPDGPQSGTFDSLREKLPYLQDVGITGIWLTGYSVCDSHHFYNIWNQYAVMEPDKFDPSLGTAASFKRMVDEAHGRGIKIFLDVITHGLMENSPVVKAHPAWFRGSTWGMADFDWTGGHKELDDWWVEMYTRFVTQYGVDGFRLDVAIYRPDLWERIRMNAAEGGHPIVIWEEGNSVIPGVTDFTQRENVIATTEGGVLNKILVNDLPGWYSRKFGKAGGYHVQIRYVDGSILEGDTTAQGPLRVSLAGLGKDKVGRRAYEMPPKSDGLLDVSLKLGNVAQKPISNITVTSDSGDRWDSSKTGWQMRPMYIENSTDSDPMVIGPDAEIQIATLAWGESSVQLSCHDNGWTGFPSDKNPFVAQGSRALFGYSALFSAMIPIFFSGEEFNATYHAAPGLSPDLYGGRDAGKGRWLYGAVLGWDEIHSDVHKDMLDDVKKMIAIRRANADVLSVVSGRQEPLLAAVSYTSDISLPVPYVRWNQHGAIVILANRDTVRGANVILRDVLKTCDLQGHQHYRVTDLWRSQAPISYTEEELYRFTCKVQPDGTSGGGLAIFRIDKA